jgi:hypothetical protein
MRLRLSFLAYVFVAIALISILFGISQAMKPNQHGADSYWEPVEKAIGKNGTMLPGNVFKIDLTRSYPNVTIGGVRLKPAMAQDSWISFMRMGDGAMMMGDLVLTADEMGPVQAKLSAEGIDITAVHNTLVGESPQVYDMHIGGQGDPAILAAKVRSALDTAGIPIGGEGALPSEPGMGLGQADKIMGHNNTMEDGVYLFDIPRAERITVNGMEMPPSMDVATIIKFQPLGNGRAATTGDFLLRPNEVKPVIKTLSENGILVTALHTHMLTEEPRMFMLHFWATGDVDRLAQGLHAALSQTNSKK